MNQTLTYACGDSTWEICSILFKDEFGLYHCPNNVPIFSTDVSNYLFYIFSVYYLTPLLVNKDLMQICNGVEDCVNISAPHSSSTLGRDWNDFTIDEKYCKERSLCHKSRPAKLDLISIHKNQICDGNIDCLQAEDEDKGIGTRYYFSIHCSIFIFNLLQSKANCS